MDAAWKFRIILFAALAVVMFGDFFGYGNVKGVKSGTEADNFHQRETDIELSDESEFPEMSAAAINRKKLLLRTKFSQAIKESCLPKMLCEISAKSERNLTEKERELMILIRSSNMAFGVNSPPTRWHFAAHMGELMKYTGDTHGSAMGCANLWPNCPISSKKLMQLSYKMNLN